MIRLSGIEKEMKGQTVLSDVSLHIEGIYGLIGPNGAGKTTLMKILSSLISMDSGQVEIEGEDYTKRKYVKQNNRIGYLPQDFMVYPKIAVGEVLDHIAMLQGIRKKADRKALVERVIGQVNLQGSEKKKMIELSGGMRKRVGIAQLLMGEAAILILDEPTAGLDIEERIRFRNLLRDLGTERTIIISSHLVEDIEFLSTKIGILKNGKVLFEGTPAELKSNGEGYVWEYETTVEQLSSLLTDKEAVQVTEEKEGLVVRAFSGRKETGARPALPRLVDGYLAVIKGAE